MDTKWQCRQVLSEQSDNACNLLVLTNTTSDRKQQNSENWDVCVELIHWLHWSVFELPIHQGLAFHLSVLYVPVFIAYFTVLSSKPMFIW